MVSPKAAIGYYLEATASNRDLFAGDNSDPYFGFLSNQNLIVGAPGLVMTAINLFGLSYGKRAVLVDMRQHPERVRSAILMGVAPTYLKMPLYHARAGKRVMDLLLEECAGDATCP